MTNSFLIALLFLPLTVFSKEKTEFPQEGYILESTLPSYEIGIPASQFITHIHRGAKVKAIEKGTVEKKADFGAVPGNYIQIECSPKKQDFCWINQETFLPAKSVERAAVLKSEIDNFENPTSKKTKGKSSSKEGNLVFVIKREMSYCQIYLTSSSSEWVHCSDLAFDKESVTAALNLEKIKLYSQYSDGYKDALQIVLKMKSESKNPFSSLAVAQEQEIRKKVEAYDKESADPDYQACGGDNFADPEG